MKGPAVQKKQDDTILIFRPVITLRNGRKLYARAYGLKAFALKVRKNK